jgi:putative oxidoreductase
MCHGGQKLFNCPPSEQPMNLAMFSLPWVAGVLEFFGGLLIVLGLFTRPVAFILSGQMAVAYFMVHAKGGFWPIINHGELAVLYCFVFLYFAAAGPGPLSLDYLIRRKT